MIEVSRATDEDAQAWEEYLAATGISHHAYSWHWSGIFSKVFGHTPYMFMAKRNGSIVGVCPIYHVRSLLFGQALISVPYLNAGGPVADDDKGIKALLLAVARLSQEMEIRYIELRQIEQSPILKARRPEKTHKVSMLLPLTPDAELLFSSFPPKLRSQIRRPSKAGYFAQVSGIQLSPEESVKAFFRVFSEHMRDLGSPTYPRKLYSCVQNAFKERARIVTIWHGTAPVAAGLTIGGPWKGMHSRNAVSQSEIPWASALRRYGKDSPNMLLYWESIKTACSDGYQSYDFGRSSPDSGTFRFKAQWGAKPRQLFWYYNIFQGKVPDVNPDNPKYEFLVRCWKKLPLPVANTLGAWLSRSIP